MQLLKIASGRYWSQGFAAGPGADAGIPSTLEQLYSELTMFVKKKAGSLSYADDPSGIRSLLSRAFAGSASLDAEPSTLDNIVHLCTTFSADPFIMSFAQNICRQLAALKHAAERSDKQQSSSSSGAGQPPPRSSDIVSFCHAALYECITHEKTAVLGWYISLYCLVEALCASPDNAQAASGSGAGRVTALDSITGGASASYH